MSRSRCGRWLASCSHDQTVKFWDVGEVANEKVDGHKRAKRVKQPKILSSTKAARDNFFADLASGDETGIVADADDPPSDDSESSNSDVEMTAKEPGECSRARNIADLDSKDPSKKAKESDNGSDSTDKNSNDDDVADSDDDIESDGDESDGNSDDED